VGANYVLPAGGAFVLSSANTGLTYTTGLTWTFGSGTPVVGDIYSGYAYINTSAVTTTSAAGTLAISNAANYSGPADEYNATITVVTGGLYSAGTMVITYSLDGNTVSNPIAIPITGTYTIPNTGLLLTFGGTTVAGDTFNFSTVPPTFTLASLATAWTTVLNSNQLFRVAHIIGGPTQSVYASAALQQAMDSHLTAAFNQNIFTRAIIQCPTDTDIDITTGFENAFSKRVSTAVGQTGTISPITGYIEERSVAWTATARAIGTPISTKLGAVAMGPIEGITSISYNAQKDSTLATSQPPFITTRTLPGAGGFYFTNGPLQSALPSDFVDLVYGFVIDEACTLTYAALLQYLNGNVRVNSNGTIFAPDAAAINAAVSSAITDVLCGTANPFGTPNASAVSATVNTNANILSTSTLPVTIRVTPFGYNSSITVNISFYNPALNIQVAA
jgi:hypothetical protein